MRGSEQDPAALGSVAVAVLPGGHVCSAVLEPLSAVLLQKNLLNQSGGNGVHSLPQARALTPQTAETDAIRFLVGTQSLKYDNQIHIIDFDDENNIINKNVLLHQVGEIWHISASPADKGVLATCYSKMSCGSPRATGRESSPWRTTTFCCGTCRRAPAGPSVSTLSASLCDPGPWHLILSPRSIRVSTPSSSVFYCRRILPCVLASSASLEGKGQLRFTSGRWSPHHNCTQVATASDTAVRGWDTRSMRQIYCMENAHGQLVRDLDFNPNKQYYLATCGDDCKVKFWDTRNVAEPVRTLEEHSHWVWNVRYNHSHDQLVLTGSSDSRVILSNMVSISSEPFGHLVDDDDLSDQEERRPEDKSQEPPQDGVIATYEEHEDSVYAVDWSSADPWLFASLSYDGRLVINRVPRALKYHILL
ncbi:PREDICTED: protein TSSC1 [Myotis davidii]|uniref:protein TSSC1 n=1 Tax=Myotis davidii TaxID=225400 RepID=UPI000767CE0B|nr:PREDICTED: protein TSSC1 [Myotis davidii]